MGTKCVSQQAATEHMPMSLPMPGHSPANNTMTNYVDPPNVHSQGNSSSTSQEKSTTCSTALSPHTINNRKRYQYLQHDSIYSCFHTAAVLFFSSSTFSSPLTYDEAYLLELDRVHKFGCLICCFLASGLAGVKHHYPAVPLHSVLVAI